MIIYKATNKINGKSYIGQTVKNLKRRRQEHINVALRKSDNFYFHCAIRKYDPKNFEWKTIAEGTCSSETLNELEKHFIQLHNTFEKGYNLTSGGKNHTMSEESRKKMSLAKRGKKFSREHKKKLSEARSGKHHSGETKRKLSLVNRGKNNPMFGRTGKNNPCVKGIIIGDDYFNSRIIAAEFVGVTPALIRYRILHKTKWLDYKYVNKGEN